MKKALAECPTTELTLFPFTLRSRRSIFGRKAGEILKVGLNI